MPHYNESMLGIIKELQEFSYEQQHREEDKYQANFWKNIKLSKNNLIINYHIPQQVLRNATIISQLFLLGSKDKIIQILS